MEASRISLGRGDNKFVRNEIACWIMSTKICCINRERVPFDIYGPVREAAAVLQVPAGAPSIRPPEQIHTNEKCICENENEKHI